MTIAIHALVFATFASTAMSLNSAKADVAEFYTNKNISMIISSGMGGGYDALARTVGRNITKHIPGHPNCQ